MAEQFEKLKLFRGRFYQNHKDELDKFNYASKKLQAAGYNDHVMPESFRRDLSRAGEKQTEKLQQLEARRDKLAAKWHESHEELRLWASAELYMRELLGLPHPEQPLPNFSVPSKPDRQQRAPEPTHEQKQKAPVKSHRRDDRER